MLNFNIFSNYLFVMPYLSVLVSSIYIYLRVNFYKVKDFTSKFDSNYNNSSINFNKFIVIYLSILFLILISTNTNLEFKSNIYILSYSFILIIYCNNTSNSHWLFGGLFSIIFSVLMSQNNNLINFFFIMEINTYLFIYVSVCQAIGVTYGQKQSVVNSILITFIINFFSSICLFTCITYIIYCSGEFIFQLTNYSSLLIFFFISIKFLSGPWVYFGVEVYKGFKYVTLLLYTLVYFIILLPKIFILFNGLLGFNSIVTFLPIIIYSFIIFNSIKNYIL